MIRLSPNDVESHNNDDLILMRQNTLGQTQSSPPSWRAQEPPFLHSMKWHDSETGIEHMTCVRADSAEALWAEVKKVVALVKTVKAARQGTQEPEPTCNFHGVAMQRQHGKDGRSWWSHRASDGSWCHGKRSQRGR
jgi:hypothetical protein